MHTAVQMYNNKKARPLWDGSLHPTTAVASPAEVHAAMEVDSDIAARPLATPMGWTLIDGATVRLGNEMKEEHREHATAFCL